MNSENQLMLKVKEGDIEKLGLLFERYKAALFGYFYHILHNREISEDLVQTVFFRILKYRNRFSGYGKFSTWIYRIAHNVCIDHFRKKKPNDYIDNFDEFPESGEESLETLYQKNENLQLLERTMMSLSKKKKEILILSKYQGLKYKEIAEILGCSESAVKVRIFRALSELREQFVKLETERL